MEVNTFKTGTDNKTEPQCQELKVSAGRLLLPIAGLEELKGTLVKGQRYDEAKKVRDIQSEIEALLIEQGCSKEGIRNAGKYIKDCTAPEGHWTKEKIAEFNKLDPTKAFNTLPKSEGCPAVQGIDLGIKTHEAHKKAWDQAKDLNQIAGFG